MMNKTGPDKLSVKTLFGASKNNFQASLNKSTRKSRIWHRKTENMTASSDLHWFSIQIYIDFPDNKSSNLYWLSSGCVRGKCGGQLSENQRLSRFSELLKEEKKKELIKTQEEIEMK